MEEGELFNYRRWRTEWNWARRSFQAAENESAERESREPVELPHMGTCGRVKKTAPGPSWTPFSAACGPGADWETLQPKKSQVRRHD